MLYIKLRKAPYETLQTALLFWRLLSDPILSGVDNLQRYGTTVPPPSGKTAISKSHVQTRHTDNSRLPIHKSSKARIRQLQKTGMGDAVPYGGLGN